MRVACASTRDPFLLCVGPHGRDRLASAAQLFTRIRMEWNGMVRVPALIGFYKGAAPETVEKAATAKDCV